MNSWYKMNVDGAFKGNPDQSGGGAVIKDLDEH